MIDLVISKFDILEEGFKKYEYDFDGSSIIDVTDKTGKRFKLVLYGNSLYWDVGTCIGIHLIGIGFILDIYNLFATHDELYPPGMKKFMGDKKVISTVNWAMDKYCEDDGVELEDDFNIHKRERVTFLHGYNWFLEDYSESMFPEEIKPVLTELREQSKIKKELENKMQSASWQVDKLKRKKEELTLREMELDVKFNTIVEELRDHRLNNP